jgi:hypothetical protein
MVVGLTSAQPVAGFADVSVKGVDRSELGETAKVVVDGGYPHLQTLRCQVGAEATMKFGGAEKPVGTV